MMNKTAVGSAFLAAVWLAPSVVRAVPSPIPWQGSSDPGDLVVTFDASIASTEGSILRRAAFPLGPSARIPGVATLPSSEEGVVHLFGGRSLEGVVSRPSLEGVIGGRSLEGVIRFGPSDSGGLDDSLEGGSPGSTGPIGDQVHAPEPATVILLGLGLASLSARRLHSRKR
jgi:hypothetical protein